MGLVLGIRPDPDTSLDILYKGQYSPTTTDDGDVAQTFSLPIPSDFPKGSSAQLYVLRTSVSPSFLRALQYA